MSSILGQLPVDEEDARTADQAKGDDGKDHSCERDLALRLQDDEVDHCTPTNQGQATADRITTQRGVTMVAHPELLSRKTNEELMCPIFPALSRIWYNSQV